MARSTEEASPLIFIIVGVVINNTYYKCETVALSVFLGGDLRSSNARSITNKLSSLYNPILCHYHGP